MYPDPFLQPLYVPPTFDDRTAAARARGSISALGTGFVGDALEAARSIGGSVGAQQEAGRLDAMANDETMRRARIAAGSSSRAQASLLDPLRTKTNRLRPVGSLVPMVLRTHFGRHFGSKLWWYWLPRPTFDEVMKIVYELARHRVWLPRDLDEATIRELEALLLRELERRYGPVKPPPDYLYIYKLFRQELSREYGPYLTVGDFAEFNEELLRHQVQVPEVPDAKSTRVLVAILRRTLERRRGAPAT
jgi:hypothetical protein